MPLNIKNINNFTQWKNGSVDVTFTHVITHQKHLAQSGHSTRSAVDIFNTLIFTKEPIREQEIKLECMNYGLITAYVFLLVNCDKIMHARWDFDVSNAWTQNVSALDKHQNWSKSALFCHNSWAQIKYPVINYRLITAYLLLRVNLDKMMGGIVP